MEALAAKIYIEVSDFFGATILLIWIKGQTAKESNNITVPSSSTFPQSEFSSGDVTLRDGSCKAVMLLMKRGQRERTKKLGP